MFYAQNGPIPLRMFGPLVVLALQLIAQPASAHFKLNLNIRIFHIEHTDAGLDVYMRLPMPYLVATPIQPDGTRPPAAFTINAMVDSEQMHYVDYDAVFADPLGLGELAASGHEFRSPSEKLTASISDIRVYRGMEQPPFSTLAEARRSFSDNQTLRIEPPPFVGDTVVDVHLTYHPGYKVTSYTLASTLDPGLEGQSETANLIVDYYGRDQQIFRLTGLLKDPVAISRSAVAALWTFIKHGVLHILAGLDHVLFVVCLTIGALALAPLAWRVTGFTIGHSITLSLGFFGYAPNAVWFVPAVETGIAISIIVMAATALGSTTGKQSGSVFDFIITALIGLLHGLGFSFVLQEILGVKSPNIWTSLLAFNVGVEVGQLAIVLLLWSILLIIARASPRLLQPTKWLIAVPCIAIASVWTGQRISDLAHALAS